LASEEGLGTASARRTSGPRLHRLVIQPDSSGGCGGHAKVEAQVEATRNETTTHFISEGITSSKGLAMNPNRKGGFDNKSPDGETGEQDITPVVQAPVAGMGDVGRGNDDEEINLASLSFGSDTKKLVLLSLGSDTEYLAEMYVIVDPKLERNGSLTMESLLQPGIVEIVTSALDEQFVE
jgi:hypothetical protein